MTTRTTTKTVTFANPFTLRPLDEVLQPGDYAVETDEELLDGLSFIAYRRIRALVHLPVQVSHPGTTRTLSVDPNELDAALMRDAFAWQNWSQPAAPVRRPYGPLSLTGLCQQR